MLSSGVPGWQIRLTLFVIYLYYFLVSGMEMGFFVFHLLQLPLPWVVRGNIKTTTATRWFVNHFLMSTSLSQLVMD